MCYQYNIISSIIFILIHSNTNSLQLIVYISHDPSSSTYVNCYNSNIQYCTIRSFDMVAANCLKPLKTCLIMVYLMISSVVISIMSLVIFALTSYYNACGQYLMTMFCLIGSHCVY